MAQDHVSRSTLSGCLPAESKPLPNNAAEAPSNLLEVKRRIKAIDLKPAKLRQDIVSALHTIARASLPSELKKPNQEQIDAALERISVHARHLLPLLHRRVGARMGYLRASWRNVPWLVKKGLKLTGAWSLFMQMHVPLTGEWQIVAQKSPKLSCIRLLGHWGMLMGVTPRDFNEVHLPLFLKWLLSWKARDYALKCYFSSLRDWNKGAQAEPGWPGRPVTVVTRLNSHYSVARELWSPDLRIDIARIIGILRRPDLDEERTFEPLKERFVKEVENRLYRVLSAYVKARELDPMTIKTFEVVLEPSAAKAALDFQIAWAQRRKPEVTRNSDVHGFAKLLATVADRCYEPPLPAETIRRLQKMARARSPIRKGMNPKNRELLKKFDDEELLARFLAMPYAVAAEILKRGEFRRVDGVRLMLAFAVAQSIEAPLRPEDQASLIDGKNIFTVMSGKTTTLAIRLTSQKTEVDLDFELSGDVVGLYDIFMRMGRKKLCALDNRHVYPGPGDGPKARGTLSPQMRRFIEDELGIRMTCQQFRHVIGYVYLKSHPGEYETVRQLLGHKDITTTMAFYASMDMRAASKKVSAFVAQKRRELAPLLRKRRSKRGPKKDQV